MNKLTTKIKDAASRSVDTIWRYPTSIALAVGFTIITFIRIYLDYTDQIPYNFILTCLHMTFGASTFIGLLSTAWSEQKEDKKKYFLYANIGTVISFIIILVILYYFGASTDSIGSGFGVRVSEISGARIAAIIGISLIWFIYFFSISHRDSNYPKALFMVQKSFIIALIYTLAVILGMTGIAGTIQALLYRGMSSKVYMYLSAISGLIGFLVFVSYFPKNNEADERWEEAQKQPKFIQILFGSILIPVISALTVVLLIWVIKTIITSNWPEFARLSSITTSYVVVGLWLYFMTSHFDTETTKKYRSIFPYTALAIMAFELVALIRQFGLHGLQTEEYVFSLLLVFGMGSSFILLMGIKDKYKMIVALLSVLIVISVLPFVGYHSAPVRYQVSRLENVLLSNSMIENGSIVHGDNISDDDKIAITDSVEFLSRIRDYELPTWMNSNYAYDKEFATVFGFDKKRISGDDAEKPYDDRNYGVFLQLSSEPLFIKDYEWVVHPSYAYSKDGALTAEVKGVKGTYSFRWFDERGYDVPKIDVYMNDKAIYEGDIKEYTDKILSIYKNGKQVEGASIEDMQMNIVTDYVDIKIIFGSVNINIDPVNDQINRWVEIKSVYFNEK